MERTPERTEKIRRVLAARQPTLTAVLEDIQDQHNIFAIFRSADAVGIDRLHLAYTLNLPTALDGGKCSSAGTAKWTTFTRHRDIAGCYAALRAEGKTILASRLDPTAKPLFELDLTQPVALVLGNEKHGVSDLAASLADGTYYIPMMGMAQSLNVSVAAAVSFYEAYRQRSLAGQYAQSSLPPEELARRAQEWLYL